MQFVLGKHRPVTTSVQNFVSLQRILPGLSRPLHPKPRSICGEQVPAEVLENQTDAHQGHGEERGRTCGGVRRRSGRKAGGKEEEEEYETGVVSCLVTRRTESKATVASQEH